MKYSLYLLLLSFSFLTYAQRPHLLLRTSFEQSYNIPTRQSISNQTPFFTSNQNIAILANKRFLLICNRQTCTQKSTAPQNSFFRIYDYTNPTPLLEVLSNNFYTHGLFTIDLNQELTQVLSPEFDFLNVQFFGISRVLDNGNIIFLAKDGGQKSFLLKQSSDGTLKIIIKQSSRNGIQFLFNPSINKKGQVAIKVRIKDNGTSPNYTDQIRLYGANGDYQIIAQTKKQFDSIDFGLDLNDRGEVAFKATFQQRKSLYFWNGQKLETLFSEQDFGKFDDFTPRLNNNGEIAFRGLQKNRRPALFYWNKKFLSVLIQEGDEVKTDLGQAQFGQHDPNYPMFAGNVSINDSGVIAFSAGLYPKGDNQQEWGTGLFTIKTR